MSSRSTFLFLSFVVLCVPQRAGLEGYSFRRVALSAPSELSRNSSTESFQARLLEDAELSLFFLQTRDQTTVSSELYTAGINYTMLASLSEFQPGFTGFYGDTIGSDEY